jgi:hypothetical protein
VPLDPNLIIIGFDAEWVRIPDTDKNNILSYQYFGKTSKGTWSGVIYPEGPTNKDRLKFIEFVGRAIEAGRAEKVLPYKWPSQVYLSAHFSRADLSAFSDFSSLKGKLDSLQKTYATLYYPFKSKYIDASNNSHSLTIHLIDTMLNSPSGSSLESLGKLHGVSKIKLPRGMIERMDKLLENDPVLFERYGIRDAEISAKHAWYMAEFVKEHLGVNAPPVTLGSLAVKHFKSLLKDSELELNDLLGKEIVSEKKYNTISKRYNTSKSKISLNRVHAHETEASEAFHGGRNEAYVFGFTEDDDWVDVDLAGAYTTAMVAIKVPDWENLKSTHDVNKFKADELGFACLKFKFPSDTRYPCLPVRTDNGLIFPIEGETYAGSPEIVLALQMGAELTNVEGMVVPWASDLRPFEPFSTDIKNKRAENIKGSPPEQTWKEIGNSLYGKLAQGIKQKRVFDSREGASAILPPSQITQPYLATYVTSLIRAVLGELLHRIPNDKLVVSATTDGFISNVPKEDLDTSGPLCTLFSELRSKLDTDASVLEEKHWANVVLCWKTRGQVDATPNAFAHPDDEGKPIIAKAGIKLPSNVKENSESSFDPYYHLINDENWQYEDEVIDGMGDAYFDPPGLEGAAYSDYMLDLFLNRKTGQKFKTSQLVSMRDMFNNDTDMVSQEGEQLLNMDYDWKRELINPIEREHGASSLEEDYPFPVTHIYAESRPWKSVEEFRKFRDLFDVWRIYKGGVLKTMDDWSDWQEYVQTDAISKKGVRRGQGGMLGQLKRTFLQAYTNEEWGLPGGDYTGLAEYLTEHGYQTSITDIKNSKRRKGELLQNAYPRTDEVMAFIKLIRDRHPDFEWEMLVGDS